MGDIADFAALGMLQARVAANPPANIAPNGCRRVLRLARHRPRCDRAGAHGLDKTVAFLLPIIEQLNPASKEPQALVISPSRELAFQTARVADLVRLGLGLGY